MIEGGLVIFVIGALLSCLGPAERAVAQRRAQHGQQMLGPHLARVFALPERDAALDALARAAEAALDEDELARGVRRVGAVYDASAND